LSSAVLAARVEILRPAEPAASVVVVVVANTRPVGVEHRISSLQPAYL
jgi:hypothetical protein